MIKKGCIEFLNRNGENFDWENDDLSELEVVNEQPKLVQLDCLSVRHWDLVGAASQLGPISNPRPLLDS